jgi:maltooligosyltrehalose trehalohydrolase
MGQEYDESAPFQFFTSFEDPIIQKAVSEGRPREFAEFGWTNVPDPQDPATFARSRLQWLQGAENLEMLAWYRALLQLRRHYILPAVRTAHAEWIAPGLLSVQIPEEAPRVRVVAALPGATLPSHEEIWVLKLENDQDGYRTQIFVKAG